MKVSKYFNSEEFACNDGCGFCAVDIRLLEALTDVREHFGKPVTITSACRCEKYNKEVGGTVKSQHTKGMACDIVIKDVDAKVVQEYLLDKYPDSYGIGRYLQFTHFDVRDNKARW